jgi:hypothetical protein
MLASNYFLIPLQGDSEVGRCAAGPPRVMKFFVVEGVTSSDIHQDAICIDPGC